MVVTRKVGNIAYDEVFDPLMQKQSEEGPGGGVEEV